MAPVLVEEEDEDDESASDVAVAVAMAVDADIDEIVALVLAGPRIRFERTDRKERIRTRSRCTNRQRRCI